MSNPKNRCVSAFGYVMLFAMIIGPAQIVSAGWSGTMNGAGYGKGIVDVISVTQKSNTVATTNMFSPARP